MTPRKLAEKIEAIFLVAWPKKNLDAIESLLSDALAQAKLDAMHTGGDVHLCEQSLKTAQAIAMFDNTCPEIYTEKVIKEAKAAAYEECAKIAEEEWKQHPYPRLPDPGENAQLTSLRIRGAIRLRAKEAGK